MGNERRLGPGREFDLIEDVIARWGERAAGIGDDAALVSVPAGEQLVVSTDSAVEHVHFRRGWLSAREIGYRATAAALSDLAAMAASPLGMLVALSCPGEWIEELGLVMDGIGDAAARGEARIVGGDLTTSRDLGITITVLGAAATPVARSGARVGDRVYVTGTLGGPRAALQALRAGQQPDVAERERFASPVPRIREAQWLARHGVHAMIDVSDGLVGDVAHVAAASRVRIALELDALPTVGGMSPADAAQSGEEYELVAVSPVELDTAAFARAHGIPLTRIGQAEAGAPGVDVSVHGARVAFAPGFNHFS